MIRRLKAFADWLDKRFPPKVVLTQEDYELVKGALASVCKEVLEDGHRIKLIAERVEATEKSIAALKDLLSKGGVMAMKPEKDLLRDEFVRGEFSRGPSRSEVEGAVSR